MIKKSIFIFLIGFSLFACANDANQKASDFTINGHINLPEGTPVIFSLIAQEKLVVKDTVYTDANGGFKWTSSEEESRIYMVTFEKANPPGVPLILENGAKIQLDITKGEHFDYTIEGGKHNADMLALYNLYSKYDRELMAFNARIAEIDPSTASAALQKSINQEYSDILQQRTIAIEEFIDSHKGSPATYFAVRYLFSKPVGKLVFIASDKLQADMPGSIYTDEMIAIKRELPANVEGAMAPDIKLPNPKGDSVMLSSLKGKVVLLDFWASWCGPCRKENPYVKEIYEKYHDKGFEIYGVSLDNKKDMWEAAIAYDDLPWVHVSDLVGWKSPAAKLYDVHSIPQTFLIDKEGRIAYVGLRHEQLELVLEDMLN